MNIPTRLKCLENEIINYYNNGETSVKIAKRYRTSPRHILSILKYNFIEIRSTQKHKRGDFEKLYKNKILDMFNSGTSILFISKTLKLCYSSVYNIIKKFRTDYKIYSVCKNHKLNDYKNDIINKWINGKSASKIAKEYGCGVNSILRILKKNNIDTSPVRKHQFDENYFNKIDNPEKAWIWGVLLTDGNNSRKSIRLKMTDFDILYKFKTATKFTGEILTVFDENKKHKTRFTCELCSQKLSKEVERKGFLPNKTFLVKYPDESIIPEDLAKYFILGLLDGDGSMQMTCINWTGTIDLLQGIEKRLIKIGVDKDKIYWYNRRPEKKDDYNIRTLAITTRENILKIVRWLYANHVISGDRKRVVAHNLIKKFGDGVI